MPLLTRIRNTSGRRHERSRQGSRSRPEQRSRHRRGVAALAVAASLVAAGCASDSDSGEASSMTTAAPTNATGLPEPAEPSDPGSAPAGATLPDVADGFPPTDTARLKAIFDPLVEPLGLRMTRGALVDRSEGYDVSPTGDHLALYVEPIDEATYSVDDYVEGIWTVTEAVSATVFDDFPGLDSFDICQEPYTDEDDRLEPFPATQVEITRANYDAFDWDNGDLISFMTFLREADDTRLLTGATVVGSPRYVEAAEAAGYGTRPAN